MLHRVVMQIIDMPHPIRLIANKAHRVRRTLTQLIHLPGWSDSAFSTLRQVQTYF